MRVLLCGALLALACPSGALDHDLEGRPLWTYCARETLAEAGWMHRFLCGLGAMRLRGECGSGGCRVSGS